MSATDFSRWAAEALIVPPWDGRNVQIAKLIRTDSSVLDIGAGNMTLRRHLASCRRYVPMDCVPTAPETAVVDLNSNDPPVFEDRFDYSVLSGVLEHLDCPERALSWASTWGREVVFSYALVETADPSTVVHSRTRLTALDLLRLLGRLHLRSLLADTWNGHVIVRAWAP